MAEETDVSTNNLAGVKCSQVNEINSEKLLLHERGRQPLGDRSCYAYFEVVAVPPGVVTLEFYAMNDIGVVLDKGIKYRISEVQPGMFFEVYVSSAPADQVAYWQIQAGNREKLMYVCKIAALTQTELRYTGEPIRYVEPPAEIVAITNALPKLKDDWTGAVVGSRRSKYFHHPECRSARAFHPNYRLEYGEPQQAWEEGLRPCYHCLYSLQ